MARESRGCSRSLPSSFRPSDAFMGRTARVQLIGVALLSNLRYASVRASPLANRAPGLQPHGSAVRGGQGLYGLYLAHLRVGGRCLGDAKIGAAVLLVLWIYNGYRLPARRCGRRELELRRMQERTADHPGLNHRTAPNRESNPGIKGIYCWASGFRKGAGAEPPRQGTSPVRALSDARCRSGCLEPLSISSRP